jgi:hypothetical protein
MSSSKLDISGVFQPVTVQARPTQLSLPAHAVRIRKNGIEFRTDKPIVTWTEMTVDLESPNGMKVHCRGVVVACTGSRHTGYTISMVFMNLSRQSQEHLSSLAVQRPA